MSDRRISDIHGDESLGSVSDAASPERWTILVELVTPMYSGGANAKKLSERPFNGKGLRGSLRHWWRRVRGPHWQALGESQDDPTYVMALAERAFFGSTDSSSPFDVTINLAGEALEDDQDAHDLTAIANLKYDARYALYGIPRGQRLIREGTRYCVTITWLVSPAALKERHNVELDAKVELRAALWGWLTYGGSGARTRRGLGAFRLVDTSDIDLKTLCANPTAYPISCTHILVASKSLKSAGDAWLEAIGLYRRFRQDRPDAAPERKSTRLRRRGGQWELKPESLPGRSRWPEADAIRLFDGSALKRVDYTLGGESFTTNEHSPNAVNEGLFPRAGLGLPIRFQFADSHPTGAVTEPSNEKANWDPSTIILKPRIRKTDGVIVAADRLASPIVIRPVLLDGEWHAAFLIYAGRQPIEGVELSRQSAGDRNQSREFERSSVEGDNLKNLPQMRDMADVRLTLIDWLLCDEQGYRELKDQ